MHSHLGEEHWLVRQSTLFRQLYIKVDPLSLIIIQRGRKSSEVRETDRLTTEQLRLCNN